VIDRGLGDEKMLEELADVLLQVAMHAAIAEEEGRFDAARVSDAAAAKMVARHPHVFAGEAGRWRGGRAANVGAPEGGGGGRRGPDRRDPVDRVPSSLPALAWTSGCSGGRRGVGFDPATLLRGGRGDRRRGGARSLAAVAGSAGGSAAGHPDAFR